MSTPTAVEQPPVPAAPPTAEPDAGAPGRPRMAGWIQTVVLVVAMVVTLRAYEVPVGDSLVFLGYITAAVMIPGTLLWRAVAGRSGALAEDLAAGLAVGYVVEILVYIAARAIGIPLLTAAWAVTTVVVFLAVPSLRVHWKGRANDLVDTPPAWWSWVNTACVAFLFAFSCLAWFRSTGISEPGYTRTDADMPYHLALVGEIRHHMPPSVPWIRSEGLHYHWFVYAEHAATSWSTGIEPQLLLYRLAPLPVLAATVFLISALARRLSGEWWAGPTAAVMTFVVLAPSAYGWQFADAFTAFGFGSVEDGSLLRPTMWMSPTQTAGTLLSLPVTLLMVGVLRGTMRGWPVWTLLSVLTVGLMGTKATFLPLYLCGLLLVLAGRWLVERRISMAALGAFGLVLACLVFAQMVLFGGVSQGLHVSPFSSMANFGSSGSAAFIPFGGAPWWRSAMMTGLFVLILAMVWAGSAGLLRYRAYLRPETMLLAGMGAAGIGAVAAFSHPGYSQYYFLESARPFLAVLSATGLALLVGRVSRRVGLMLGGAVAVGVVTLYAVRWLDGPTVPVLGGGSVRPRHIALMLVWPNVALMLAVGAVAVLLYLNRHRVGGRAMVIALVVAMVTGFAVPSWVDQVKQQAFRYPNNYLGIVDQIQNLTPGSRAAGRWLRDHSDPADLVATNAHCRWIDIAGCAPLQFSVAAYSERRVLLEGWGYTASLNAQIIAGGDLSFWDDGLLAANDAAFERPSAETVGFLRDRYGVRWLFADDLRGRPSPELGRFATFRFRAGNCAVYEIPARS